MPLQTIHRPTTLEEFYGNPHVKDSLESVLSRKEDQPHSFLITGPSGCGKTTLALIIKNMIGCKDSDFYYYNAANTRGIDTIREIDENSKFVPMFGKTKMFVLDEVHQGTGTAQESLLLLLESPPAYCYFVLCTTEPERLKDTLKRRCHHYNLMPLKKTELTDLLNHTLKQEKVKDFPKEVLNTIYRISDGSAGKALKYLDMVIDVENEEYAIKCLEAESDEGAVIDLCRILVDFKNTADVRWKEAKSILSSLEPDAETVRYMVLGYLNKCILGDNNPALFAPLVANFSDPFISSGKAGLSLAVYLSLFTK